MYDTFSILRRLRGWLLVCACLGATIANAASGSWTFHNVGTNFVDVYYYNPFSSMWGGATFGRLQAGQSGTQSNGLTNQLAWYWSPPCNQGNAQLLSSGTYNISGNSCTPGTQNYTNSHKSVCLTNTTMVNGMPYRVYKCIDGGDRIRISDQGTPALFDDILPNGASRCWEVSLTDGHLVTCLYIEYFENDLWKTKQGTGSDDVSGNNPGNGGDTTQKTDGQEPSDNYPSGTNTVVNDAALLKSLAELQAEVRKLNKEPTQQAATNLLGEISQKLGTNSNGWATNLAKEGTLQNLTNLLGAGMATLQSTMNSNAAQAHNDFTNMSNPNNTPQWWSNLNASATMQSNLVGATIAGIAANPWSESFTNGGILQPLMNAMTALGSANTVGGGRGLTNGLIGTLTGSEPEPTEDWFKWIQPTFALTLPHAGRVDTKAWTWKLTPSLPSSSLGQSAFLASFGMMKLALSVAMLFLLYWDIYADIQWRIVMLAMVPQAHGTGTKIGGVELGKAAQLWAAAIVCAAIYTFAAYLTGWLTDIAVGELDPNDTSWATLKSTMETGTIGSYYSIWIPRVLKWVEYVFPFYTAFGCISLWCTYQLTRDWASKVAIIALKKAGGLIVVTGLLFLGATNAQASYADCGNQGKVTLTILGTNNATVTLGGETVVIGPGQWTVAPCLDSIEYAGASNYLGGATLIDGTSIVVGSPTPVVSRPDTVDRENALLMWGSAGLMTGVFFGCLSLFGYIFKRGLFPAGHWGGGDA